MPALEVGSANPSAGFASFRSAMSILQLPSQIFLEQRRQFRLGFARPQILFGHDGIFQCA